MSLHHHALLLLFSVSLTHTGFSRSFALPSKHPETPEVTSTTTTPWITALFSSEEEPPAALDWSDPLLEIPSAGTSQPLPSSSTESRRSLDQSHDAYSTQNPARTSLTTRNFPGASHTPPAGGTSEASALPTGLMWISEETAGLAEASTVSVSEQTVDAVRRQRDGGNTPGLKQVTEEQNGQITTTVEKVTETQASASAADSSTPSACAGTCRHPTAPPPADETTPQDVIAPPLDALTPPLLVPLLADWNAAMATWGLAWQLQAYGVAGVFCLVAALSALSLLCLPLRCPSGCAHFSLLHLLQLLTGSSRALWLLYDPYGQRERLSPAWARLLHEAAYPCLTASFGLLLLLLTARSCTQLLSHNTLQRSGCLLAALALLHVAVLMVSLATLRLFPDLQMVPFLPPAAFVVMSSLLSLTFLLLYCCARADAEHIYRLSESSPEHPTLHASHCPFTEARMWARAASAGVFSALFLLACAGLRLYAMLHAGGLTGEGTIGLTPWPWLAFQLSCRVCEAGVCLTLALVITHPLLCCGIPIANPTGCSWRFKKQVSEGGTAASSILPTRCGWSLRPAEKLGLCEGIARRESESVPLYTLVDLPQSDSGGLDLNFPSPQHQPSTLLIKTLKASRAGSFVSLDADSTVDLRPPSPIDLRRSIDEALNSEALFQHSLFSSSRLSLSTRGPPDGQPCWGSPAQTSLHRAASCGDVDPAVPANPPSQWSTIQVRASVGGGTNSTPQSQNGLCGQRLHRRLTTPGSTTSTRNLEVDTQPPVDELAIQAEFIHVCRQIDALSISSDTIDL